VNSIESTPELRKNAMETLCALICQLGRKYTIFMPLVARTLNKCQYNYPPYDMLITYISSVCDQINFTKQYRFLIKFFLEQ